MLDARMPVNDHVQIPLQGGAPFGVDHHAQLPGRLQYLLPLVPPWLIVRLDRKAAERLDPAQMGAGVIQRIDHRLGPAAFCAVEDSARGVYPRPQDRAGLLQLRVGENVLGAAGRVVRRGDAKSEIGQIAPVLLWSDPIAGVPQVRMHINEAGDNKFAAHVNRFGPFRHGSVCAAAKGGNSAIGDDDDGVRDDARFIHGNDGGPGKDHGALGLIGFVPPAQRDPGCVGSRQRIGGAGKEVEQVGQLAFVQHGADGPAHRLAVTRPMDAFRSVPARFGHRQLAHVR